MIDLEALAAPAFLVELSARGTLAGLHLNAAGRACPELTQWLTDMPPAAWAAALASTVRGDGEGSAVGTTLAGARSGSVGWRAVLSSVVGRRGRAEAVLGLCHQDRQAGREINPIAGHLSLTLQAIHGAEWRYDVRRDVYEGSNEIATLIGEAAPRSVTWAEWLARVHPQDLPAFLARPEPEGAAEFRFRAVDGELRWARCSRVAVPDEAGAVEAVLGIMVDITPERVRETAWADLATHDPLTGLLNRRGLRREVEQLQSEPPRTPCLALLAVDLDRFKQTNDAHGHAAGDAVLAKAARRLGSALGGGICARLGGDEFVALVPVSGEAEAMDVRDRLQGAFRRPLAFRGRWLPVSASVGVACSSGAADIARLMDDADADLYARKRAAACARAAAA